MPTNSWSRRSHRGLSPLQFDRYWTDSERFQNFYRLGTVTFYTKMLLAQLARNFQLAIRIHSGGHSAFRLLPSPLRVAHWSQPWRLYRSSSLSVQIETVATWVWMHCSSAWDPPGTTAGRQGTWCSVCMEGCARDASPSLDVRAKSDEGCVSDASPSEDAGLEAHPHLDELLRIPTPHYRSCEWC